MSETLDFLTRHGPLVLFLAVFVEQMGLPLPAAPWLLAAGALIGADKTHGLTALVSAMCGSLPADLIWFYLGQYYGNSVLQLICRISLESAPEHRATARTVVDPRALHMTLDELQLRHEEIPRDRDVILYCSCPNEESSARAALLLRRNGIVRVHPLLGGFDAWRERNYPTESRVARAAIVSAVRPTIK